MVHDKQPDEALQPHTLSLCIGGVHGKHDDTGKHSAHLQLPAIVHGNQSDGGCPPFLRVVPQQDVCDCDDDEGLGCVTQPTQQPVDGAEQDVAPEGRNTSIVV